MNYLCTSGESNSKILSHCKSWTNFERKKNHTRQPERPQLQFCACLSPGLEHAGTVSVLSPACPCQSISPSWTRSSQSNRPTPFAPHPSPCTLKNACECVAFNNPKKKECDAGFRWQPTVQKFENRETGFGASAAACHGCGYKVGGVWGEEMIVLFLLYSAQVLS